MITRADKVLVFGGKGMAGSAIIRALQADGFANIIAPLRQELDLLDRQRVFNYLNQTETTAVIMAAAKVGGIMANKNDQAGFFSQNMQMELNVIDAAHHTGIHHLIFLGSSCVYPRHAEQPIRESSLLTGPLEITNEGYALAKIGGIRLCAYYRNAFGSHYFSVMPTNLYGPGDNYHPTDSHVLPALIRKFHEAKSANAKTVELWGSGNVLREFLHVDDLGKAISLLVITGPHPELINLGSGTEITIAALASVIAKVTGFEGDIRCDTSKPDGRPRKLLDTSYLNKLGWKPSIDLESGIRSTYRDFLAGKGRNTGNF